jgi:hypothetical protein
MCKKGKVAVMRRNIVLIIFFYVRVIFSTPKHIFLTYSSIAMWLIVLHLTLVHAHVLNIGEKAQPDLDQ